MFNAAQYVDDTTLALPPPSSAASFALSVPKRAGNVCSNCPVRATCMPETLTPSELARLDSIICSTRTIRRGESLYRANDTFQSVYAVRSGSFKTVVMHRDGREQVTGFNLAGEMLGLDGVHTERHSCDAIALEDSSVCIVPFSVLEGLCHEMKAMQQHVHRMMSGEIVRESGLMMLLGTMTAEQRVAAFLLNLSQRLKTRGYSAAEFNLRMTREDMGSYLGTTLETVSRTLSRFQKRGLIDTQGKFIRIVDLEGLRAV